MLTVDFVIKSLTMQQRLKIYDKKKRKLHSIKSYMDRIKVESLHSLNMCT